MSFQEKASGEQGIRKQEPAINSRDSEFLAVGRVVAPWGIRGELKVDVLTDFPERFAPRNKVYIDGCAVTIEWSRYHEGRAIVKLSGIDHVEAAERLRGQYLEIRHADAHPLPEGQYYQFQLIGLEVWTTKGELLGSVTDILPTGSNDVYVVHSDDRELLIPAIEDVVKSVDLEKGRMVIEVIDGLLEYTRTA